MRGRQLWFYYAPVLWRDSRGNEGVARNFVALRSGEPWTWCSTLQFISYTGILWFIRKIFILDKNIEQYDSLWNVT